jgi:SAM-dependent methyltransferase
MQSEAERFKPISIKPPSANPLLFRMRCVVDLQLNSTVKHLRPAIAALQGRILDIGAGESPWKEWLPNGCVYQGIDVENAHEYGMQKGQDIVYYDGKSIPFPDQSFDGALCIEVLEHVEQPEPFLSEIARVLKKGAPLLLTVPWSARRHHIPHDYHRFTKEKLAALLNQQSFTNIEIRERGNDISAIANKLIVLSIRLAKPNHLLSALWTLPLAFFLAPFTLAMLLAAHISDAIGKGAKEDPLGYFLRAVRN